MGRITNFKTLGLRGIVQMVRILRLVFLILACGHLQVNLADDNRNLVVMSYNIRHGQGMDGQVDLIRTAATISKHNPDIVGLQEVDMECQRSGNTNQPKQLGAALGMHAAFGSFMEFQGGKYGLAILSKFPILKSTEIRLPDGNEPRVALVAEVQLPDESLLLVVNVHFDWVRNDQFRFIQAKAVHDFLDRQDLPFILVGDFNDSPESRTLQLFRKSLVELPKPADDRFTFSSTKPSREIDYMFLSNPSHLLPASVVVADETLTSDHRPLIAELVRVGDDKEILVRITAKLPKDSASCRAESIPSRAVYLSGNLPELGNWKPDGLEMKAQGDDVCVAQFRAKVGTTIEYKITQGSWSTVEKSTTGVDIPNRSLTVVANGKSECLEVQIQVERWADHRDTFPSSVQGELRWHKDFASSLVAARHIAVWLPAGYDDTTSRYPVLYLHDGQNLFDIKTAAFGVEWQVDESVTALIQQQLIEPVIIVGIWNTPDRIDEYTTTISKQLGKGGKGETYIRFLVEELKPAIDREYRTLSDSENTLIGGSSLGGLISIHAWYNRPDCFGKCLAFSPSLHWDDERLLVELAAVHRIAPSGQLWLSMGTHEGRSEETRDTNVNRARRLAELLKQTDRHSAERIEYLEVQGGQHNEAAWAVQFPLALQFVLGKPRNETAK